MKVFGFSIVYFVAGCTSAIATQCHVMPARIPTDWLTMVKPCRETVRRQIQINVSASLQYLAMGAHFSRNEVNRPGFAKMFFEAAGKEREHAIKLIEYLLMRGELTSDIASLIIIRPPESKAWQNGVDALEAALKMESEITRHLGSLIRTCEDDADFDDYHLVDYINGKFFEEQYKNQRDLAGKASTLKRMLDRQPALGEFIFDKKLLGMNI